jgi:type IV secretory pathway VirB2 component (pilin)
MTDAAKKRLTLRHALAGVAVLALLIGFGQPWSVITLTTGQTIALSGNDQAPLALSLLLVTAAAHALSLLVYRGAHLVAVIVQTLSALGALWATASALGGAVSAARPQITQLTGLSGADTINELVSQVTAAPFATGVSVVGVTAFGLSALLGLTVWRERRTTVSRFDRPTGTSEQHPWDELSDGGDPTAR